MVPPVGWPTKITKKPLSFSGGKDEFPPNWLASIGWKVLRLPLEEERNSP